MEKYSDYAPEGELTKEDLAKINWTKYKIIVPTEKDKKDLMEAFKHFHNCMIDTDYVTVNQLAHEYLSEEDGGNNITISKKLYELIEKHKK